MDGFTFKQRPQRRPASGVALYGCSSLLATALSGRVGHIINFSCRPGSGPHAPRQGFAMQPSSHIFGSSARLFLRGDCTWLHRMLAARGWGQVSLSQRMQMWRPGLAQVPCKVLSLAPTFSRPESEVFTGRAELSSSCSWLSLVLLPSFREPFLLSDVRGLGHWLCCLS